MLWVRIQDAMVLWDNRPQPVPRWTWLRVKASISVALGLECHQMDYDSIAVWASEQHTRWSFDGPECNWQEVSVKPGLLDWRHWRYQNGF